MKITILDYFEKKNFISNWRLKSGSMILGGLKLIIIVYLGDLLSLQVWRPATYEFFIFWHRYVITTLKFKFSKKSLYKLSYPVRWSTENEYTLIIARKIALNRVIYINIKEIKGLENTCGMPILFKSNIRVIVTFQKCRLPRRHFYNFILTSVTFGK